MITIHCKELGIEDCNWTASGDTPGEVVDQAVAHLRKDHGLDMPDTDEILEGDAENPIFDDVDEGVAIMIRRLREALGIEPRADETEASPVAIGRAPEA